MSNPFYTPSGNPGTGAEGLSSLMRSEFAAIGAAFELIPSFTTTGEFATIFNQFGNFSFNLPAQAGTLALQSDVAANAAAISLLAPRDSPHITGAPTVPTPPTLDNSTAPANTAWVGNFLAASGFAPAGASPVVTVAGRTGAVTLAHTDITDWNATLAPYSAATSQALNDAGRNFFHNSMFRIQQRGAGPFTASGAFTADRWLIGSGAGGGTRSVTLLSVSDAERAQIGDETANSKLTNAFSGGVAAGDLDALIHRVENVKGLAGKTVTISFYAAATAGTPKIGLNVVQSFGTGGTPSANVVVLSPGLSVTLSTTWTRYSVSIAIPSISGKTFGTSGAFTQFQFYYSSGSNNNNQAGNIGTQSATVSFWGMQGEIAPAASPLEKLGFQQDLVNCQRFYQIGQCIITGYGLTGTGAGQTYTLPVSMHGVPVIATPASGNVNISSFIATALGTFAIWFNGVVTASGAWTVNTGIFTALSEL